MGLKFKKTLFKALVVLSVLALFLVSVDWFLAATNFDQRLGWIGLRNLNNPDYLQLIAPICLVILSVFTIISQLASSAESKLVTKTETGDIIKLNPKAVEKVIKKKILKEIPEVNKATITADQKYALFFATDKLNIGVAIDVSADTKISNLNTKIKQHTQDVLKQIFGLDDKYIIRVTVYNVSTTRGSRKRKASSKEESSKKSSKSAEQKESAVS